MNATPKIAVLLSTYNGEAFLDIQLQSIVEQTYTNHVIVARDDGSRDGTLALLREWQRQHPERLYLIADCPDNLGARGSFAWLVDYVLAHKAELGLERAYLMFCDQDDRWFPQKMAVEVEAMLAAEDAGGDALPVLVHSDLRVVTEAEGLIAESFVRYQGLEIERNRFPNMVISNLVTGCTVLINEPLAHKAMPVPDDAIMHDWWLALVAAAFGRVVFLDQPLVHYRQHGSNTIGAKEFARARLAEPGFWQRVLARQPNVHLREVATQAVCFRRRYQCDLSPGDRIALRVCAAMAVRAGMVQRLFYRLARRF